ncbi:hypothetical protein [Klebsiella aerogenes]|uniref:hypothetical protein n=1 Tax=Klebsiella aerogenes TaxID=548 RepID=UPI0034D1EF75
MTEQAPGVSTEICVSRIFEIVQSMSGQGNTITIPCPYLDFFAGDQQAHLLAAILNQLVFWSGKSHLQEGWFYKEHVVIAKELRVGGKCPEDVIRKAMDKIVSHYLPGVIEKKKRKVNGTPKVHYRIDGDALISRIFPALLETEELPNGNGITAETMETAKLPNGNGNIAESLETEELPNGNGITADSFLYTDLKNTDLKDKKISCPETASPDEKLSTGNDQIDVSEPTSARKWGTEEDLQCAKWFWSRIIRLYEKAAETDGELSRPKEPNWNTWANDVRLMRSADGRTHRQICEMLSRAQRDRFWCSQVLSPGRLREKWDELTLKLCPADLSDRGSGFGMSAGLDTTIPKGFRG